MIDRTTAPLTSLPTSLDLPTQTMFNSSGVKLYALPATGAQVVRLSLVFAGGSSVQSVPYSAASTLSMLSEGSTTLSAQQIAEKLDYYGIFYDSTTDRDFCIITVATITKFLPQTLDILQHILTAPAFEDSELEIHKAKKRQGLIADRQKPSYIAREAFARQLFGTDHPYGRFYDTDDILKLTRENLVDYHRQFLVAEKLFAVCSGEVNGEQIALIEAFLAKIPHNSEICSVKELKEPVSSASTTTKTRESSAPAVQSCIRMGKILFNKNDDRYIPMQLLLTVLGGYFSSRLMSNLREDKGFTYGAYASMVSLASCGYMAISTDVAIESQQAALNEINAEINALKTTLIPDNELQMAKNTITGELMRLLDGPFGIADIAIENISTGLSSDYINHFLATINATTPEQLRELALTHLTDFTTVLVH